MRQTAEPESNYQYLEDGMLVVARDDGKVIACKDAAEAIQEFGHDLELVDCSDKVRSIAPKQTRLLGVWASRAICAFEINTTQVRCLTARVACCARLSSHTCCPPLPLHTAHRARLRRLPHPLSADRHCRLVWRATPGVAAELKKYWLGRKSVSVQL